MFGLGMPELIVILVIVLVIFGANRLPQLGEGLGKAIKGFKKGISDSSESAKDSDKKESKS
jgi:sec-independent protein translocase protein TatA